MQIMSKPMLLLRRRYRALLLAMFPSPRLKSPVSTLLRTAQLACVLDTPLREEHTLSTMKTVDVPRYLSRLLPL